MARLEKIQREERAKPKMIEAEEQERVNGLYIESAELPIDTFESDFPDGNLRFPFVNRKSAVKEMVRTYHSNLTVGKRTLAKPVLCLSDNISGAGKTAFGRQFINHLGKSDYFQGNYREFYKDDIDALRNAFHVEVNFADSTGAPPSFCDMYMCMMWYIRRALVKTFQIKPASWGEYELIPDSAFRYMIDSLCSYLFENGKIARESESCVFFLHFDGIEALDGISIESETTLIDKYSALCDLLHSIMSHRCSHIFLVTGKGFGLARTTFGATYRLRIGCFQQTHIEEILCKGTKFVNGAHIPFTEALNIQNSQQLAEWSKAILWQTGGIPRFVELLISSLLNDMNAPLNFSVELLEKHANAALERMPGFEIPNFGVLDDKTLNKQLQCLLQVLACIRENEVVDLYGCMMDTPISISRNCFLFPAWLDCLQRNKFLL